MECVSSIAYLFPHAVSEWSVYLPLCTCFHMQSSECDEFEGQDCFHMP